MAKKTMKFATKAIHAGLTPDSATGAVMTPIYQSSTFRQNSPGDHKGFVYSRTGNPTRKALEDNLAALENGKFGFCFGSGMAAIDAVLKLLKPGDELIASDDLYGGSYRIFTEIFAPLGIRFKFISKMDSVQIESELSPKTKLIWLETPSNPMMNLVDIEAVANLAQKHEILLAVDNTFATPFLQNPLDLGADIVMHSASKYLGGHSDVVMGALVCRSEDLAERLHFIQKSCGAVPGPQDCFLVLRGIKTLHLRMERHCKNGSRIAQFLRSHDAVGRVYWPGFDDHPKHFIAKKQMKDFGGMISFTLKNAKLEQTHQTMARFKLFSLAESLGGVESLCCHPVSMTHASVPKEQRDQAGIVDSLIRLSVGIEDIEDLLSDLDQAFQGQ